MPQVDLGQLLLDPGQPVGQLAAWAADAVHAADRHGAVHVLHQLDGRPDVLQRSPELAGVERAALVDHEHRIAVLVARPAHVAVPSGVVEDRAEASLLAGLVAAWVGGELTHARLSMRRIAVYLRDHVGLFR